MSKQAESLVAKKLYKTAKTKVQIDNIPAGTFVRVQYEYTDILGRDIYTIRTATQSRIGDVLSEKLERFVL